jgi:16S rRNA processing protein RimM
VKLEGVDDRGEAGENVGANLFVDTTELDVALPDFELPYQVIGMRVRTEDGREVGTLTGVILSTAQAIYQVTGETGTVLIPAVPAFIIARDSERCEMTVRPIPGLLDG